MINMVPNPKALSDDLGHAGTGPQITGKADQFGSLHQNPFQLSFRLRIQLRRSSRSGSGGDAFRPLLSIRGVPSADTAPIDTDRTGHLRRLIAFVQKFQRMFAAALQTLGLPVGLMPILLA